MNAVTNKYDCDTVNILRNIHNDIKDCIKKYTNEIKRIIINDNEDDNYYKKTY